MKNGKQINLRVSEEHFDRLTEEAAKRTLILGREVSRQDIILTAIASALREAYRRDHRACPNCGNTETLLVAKWELTGSIPNHGKAKCQKCGWQGTINDLGPGLVLSRTIEVNLPGLDKAEDLAIEERQREVLRMRGIDPDEKTPVKNEIIDNIFWLEIK